MEGVSSNKKSFSTIKQKNLTVLLKIEIIEIFKKRKVPQSNPKN